MSRRTKAKKRESRIIGFRAFSDSDADLVAWWEAIKPGDRSDAMRELIRFALGYQPMCEKPADVLADVRKDITWMRQALNDLPDYVERVVQQVAANTTVAIEAHAPVVPSPNGHAANDSEASRRAQRMKKNRW